MKAFNAALSQYKNEETAFKVAWSAVKKFRESVRTLEDRLLKRRSK